METRDAKLFSQNVFEINHLSVDPKLLGAQHRFPFKKSFITLKIPTSDEVVDKPPNPYSFVWASVGTRRAADNKPKDYDVHQVRVEVSIPIIYPFPIDAFNRPAVAYDLFSDEERKKINKITLQHGTLAEEGFEYWLRVVQWTCSDSRIGSSQTNAHHNLGTRLFDAESDTKLWIEGGIFAIMGTTFISVDLWQEIQARVEAGLQPPIYIDLKHNAEESFRVRDYRSTLIETAMACETFLRSTVLQKLPKVLSTEMIKHIEDARIFHFQKDFFPSILSGEALQHYREIKYDLELLFKKRNTLVHTGKSDGINEELCGRLLKVMQKLLSIKVELD